MRSFGIFVSKTARLPEAPIPTSRLARVLQSLKRRLDDDVEEVFRRACAINDLESASDLLTLMEKWHARRADSYGRERRISDASLVRARGEVERLCQMRDLRAAAAEAKSRGAA